MTVTATLPLDRADLTAAVDRAAATGERMLLTSDGPPVAAIVSAADVAWLEALEDELDAEALRRARAELGAQRSQNGGARRSGPRTRSGRLSRVCRIEVAARAERNLRRLMLVLRVAHQREVYR